MCYDIKVLHETILKRAKRKHDPIQIEAILKELEDFKGSEFHHVSGYSHPSIPTYTSESPNRPKLLKWGLIPFWIKDETAAKKIQNSTLNARSETIFEKAAFRSSAKRKHCLIFVDGFYEHYHSLGKTFPHFIQSYNQQELALAGLCDEWINPETGEINKSFSILTTKGEGILKSIHNNPKLSEPRMPLILNEIDQEAWLTDEFDKEKLHQLIANKTPVKLKAHTVRRLRGKEYLGNVAEATKKHNYPELNNTLKLDL